MSQQDERQEALATYLNDHLAGATGGLELARRLADRYRDGGAGPFLDQLAREVEQDRDMLKDAMERLGDTREQHQAGDGVGGREGEPAQAQRRVRDSLAPEPPDRARGDGARVEGKLSLWRSLESAGVSAGLDLPRA